MSWLWWVLQSKLSPHQALEDPRSRKPYQCADCEKRSAQVPACQSRKTHRSWRSSSWVDFEKLFLVTCPHVFIFSPKFIFLLSPRTCFFTFLFFFFLFGPLQLRNSLIIMLQSIFGLFAKASRKSQLLSLRLGRPGSPDQGIGCGRSCQEWTKRRNLFWSKERREELQRKTWSVPLEQWHLRAGSWGCHWIALFSLPWLGGNKSLLVSGIYPEKILFWTNNLISWLFCWVLRKKRFLFFFFKCMFDHWTWTFVALELH